MTQPRKYGSFAKKRGAEVILDFRPISLIHSIAKIITKMLNLRIGPFMNDLVSKAQNALIEKEAYMPTSSM